MNKETFVTLFDINYLPQGLALYKSLISKGQNFNLYVLCLDSKTFNILNEQKNKNIILLKLNEFETEELKEKSRTKGEYAWTLTPWSIQFVFNADPQLKRVTYLDADLFFIKNPKEIFDEFDKSNKEIFN